VSVPYLSVSTGGRDGVTRPVDNDRFLQNYDARAPTLTISECGLLCRTRHGTVGNAQLRYFVIHRPNDPALSRANRTR
jgi:hypothetical protein